LWFRSRRRAVSRRRTLDRHSTCQARQSKSATQDEQPARSFGAESAPQISRSSGCKCLAERRAIRSSVCGERPCSRLSSISNPHCAACLTAALKACMVSVSGAPPHALRRSSGTDKSRPWARFLASFSGCELEPGSSESTIGISDVRSGSLEWNRAIAPPARMKNTSRSELQLSPAAALFVSATIRLSAGQHPTRERSRRSCLYRTEYGTSLA